MTEPNAAVIAQTFILLIEDDADHARAIELMSAHADLFPFSLVRAESLAAALEVLRSERPALILLDMHLPDGQGLSLLGRVRAAAPEIPVIVLTALDDDQLSTEALKAGAQDYLVKGDFNVRTFAQTIRHSLVRHELLSDLENARSREAQRATHDDLTGLPNRLLFFDRLGHALDRCVRSSASLAVVFLDLDGFKEVNDAHGHGAGDAILREVARRLSANLRATDTVARLGGDEFTVLYEQLRDRDSAEVLVRGLRNLFSMPITIDAREHRISVSAGLALYPDDGLDAAALVGVADTAMYKDKAASRAQDA